MSKVQGYLVRLSRVGGGSQIERRLHLARYEFATGLPLGDRVLDCACGTGYGTRILARAEGRAVLGIDLSEDAILEARQSAPSGNVSFVLGGCHGRIELSGTLFRHCEL